MISNKLLRQNLLNRRMEFHQDNSKLQVAIEQLHFQILTTLDELEKNCAKNSLNIAFYSPIHGEFDLFFTLSTWMYKHSGRTLSLPITQKNKALEFHLWQPGVEMRPGAYEILEPIGTEPTNPDIILAPCLGWQSKDFQLWRIGYGAGYYDRTLEHLKNLGFHPTLVGVGLEESEVMTSDWSPAPHDHPLNLLITPTTCRYSKSISTE